MVETVIKFIKQVVSEKTEGTEAIVFINISQYKLIQMLT